MHSALLAHLSAFALLSLSLSLLFDFFCLCFRLPPVRDPPPLHSRKKKGKRRQRGEREKGEGKQMCDGGCLLGALARGVAGQPSLIRSQRCPLPPLLHLGPSLIMLSSSNSAVIRGCAIHLVVIVSACPPAPVSFFSPLASSAACLSLFPAASCLLAIAA